MVTMPHSRPRHQPHPQIFYTLSTTPDRDALSIRLDHFLPDGSHHDSQVHTISMRPKTSTAVIELSANGVSAGQRIRLHPDSVVCVDFLPKVFGSVVVMYAMTADRVAVFMQPFMAGIGVEKRPVAVFDQRGGGFEVLGKWEMVPVKLEAEERDWEGDVCMDGAHDGESGLQMFQYALARVFGEGMRVRWGGDQMLPACC
jgi:hypothetical protein